LPRPRTPLAKAKATGQDIIHSTRFANRKEPESAGPLGPPPAWLKNPAADAWESWIASVARAELAAGCADTRMLNLLRQCLGQLGATPADSTKVTLPEETTADPSDKYFS
jgi:hypothetical protein